MGRQGRTAEALHHSTERSEWVAPNFCKQRVIHVARDAVRRRASTVLSHESLGKVVIEPLSHRGEEKQWLIGGGGICAMRDDRCPWTPDLDGRVARVITVLETVPKKERNRVHSLDVFLNTDLLY